MTPRVSVVIPTYRRRDLVVRAVRALDAQRYDRAFEVIVVVDGSDDGTADALRALEVHVPLTVIEQPNRGRAAACNKGAGVAVGDLLLFLDDDMEADPGMIAAHDAAHDERTVVMGDIPLHPDSPDTFLAEAVGGWAAERRRRLLSSDAEIPITDLLTGQMSVRRNVFFDVGAFDEGFTKDGAYGNEDLDLGIRLAAAGLRIVFAPDAISRQAYVVTPRQYVAQWRDGGRADATFARKHPDRAAALWAERRASGWRFRLLWRPIVAIPGLGVALAALVGQPILRAAERHPERRMMHTFKLARDIAYWRGVRQGGGMALGRHAVVLAYHAIAAVDDPVHGRYCVTPKRLDRQLALLRRAGACFIDADRLLAHIRGERELPRRAVLVTFDDCYTDLASAAVPILRRHGVPAVAFAVSGEVGGTNSWDARLGRTSLDLLDADALRSLPANAVEIGAHSRTHPELPRTDDGRLLDEIRGSLDDLEALGLPRPRTFAYPYGEHDARVRQAAEGAGLAMAFAITPGRVYRGADLFALPRIEVQRDDTPLTVLLRTLGLEAPTHAQLRAAAGRVLAGLRARAPARR